MPADKKTTCYYVVETVYKTGFHLNDRRYSRVQITKIRSRLQLCDVFRHPRSCGFMQQSGIACAEIIRCMHRI